MGAYDKPPTRHTLKRRIKRLEQIVKREYDTAVDRGKIIEEQRKELEQCHKIHGHSKEEVICTCGLYIPGNEIVGVGPG